MGYKIKEKRKKIKMTQEELSKKSNVSRGIISGLESGKVPTTTTKTLKRIADALGVSIQELFYNEDVQHAVQIENQNQTA